MGIGSYVHWDRRLDGLLAQAICSIQAVKGVEIGLGFEAAARSGSKVHDVIEYTAGAGFSHRTNRAGGITGGVSNGEPIDLRAAVKPISTLRQPLESVDLRSKDKVVAHYERSDVCIVPAAGVIGEAMVCLTLVNPLLEKFGADSIAEIGRNFDAYMAASVET